MARVTRPARPVQRFLGGRRACAVVLFTLACGACTDRATWPEIDPPAIPEARADGWPVGSAEEHGLDPSRLGLMHELLQMNRTGGVDAVLVARNGALVYEGYSDPGTGIDQTHMLASGTKSVISLLVGAASAAGLVEGPEQPISELFPELADIFVAEPAKNGITLGHVLTMTSGLRWDQEAVGDREQDGFYMRSAPDAARYVLERHLVAEPGTRFLYSGGNSMLLSAVVRNVTGLEADAFAEDALFGPLGIETYLWQHIDDGLADADGGLHLRGRDFLKLGQLVLQNGTWEGQRVVPASWVEMSTRAWTGTDQANTRYGFQWWMYELPRSDGTVDREGIVLASGFGGQKLFVVPQLDLVMVTYGCTGNDGYLTGYDCGYAHNAGELLLYNYVLKGIEGL